MIMVAKSSIRPSMPWSPSGGQAPQPGAQDLNARCQADDGRHAKHHEAQVGVRLNHRRHAHARRCNRQAHAGGHEDPVQVGPVGNRLAGLKDALRGAHQSFPPASAHQPPAFAPVR
jgi:hypothetical protein